MIKFLEFTHAHKVVSFLGRAWTDYRKTNCDLII